MKTVPLSIIAIVFLVFSGINFVYAQTSTSHVMGKFPLSSEIANLMMRSCARINDLGDVDPQVVQFVKQTNPKIEVSNDNAQDLFWNTLYTKFVSQVPEFKSLGGKNETISIQMGENVATSCPPIQGGNATFQVNGNQLTYRIGFYSDSQAFYYKSISIMHASQNQQTAMPPPSPPVSKYPYTSKIFSIFQIDPEVVHPNETATVHILVTNNGNYTLYDVNVGESFNDSNYITLYDLHKINVLKPNQTSEILGKLDVSSDVKPADYSDIWWTVTAGNQTGKMMESMQFHRNLAIMQNSPTYCCGKSVTIILESPLKQFKTGIAANDIKCEQGLQLVIKAEDSSPACVKPEASKILVERGWGTYVTSNSTQNQFSAILSAQPKRITGLGNDTGMVTLGNKRYYFETPNYTETVNVNPVQISFFHDVVFTIYPQSPRGELVDGCERKYYWTDAKFSDGTHELLHIFVDSQPCLAHFPSTYFSTHTNPQAGLTFYDGKMKLLVSMKEVTHDAAYLSQTVDEWKNKTPEQLDAYYKKYKDTFYTELGSFLIKNEMKKELERQKIQNIHDDFKVFPGMSLDSLPPHISYDAVVNATDGNSYLLLGGVFANKIESLKITKLVFDKDVLNSLSTGKKPSYTNQFEKAPKVVISERSGTNPIVEPYNLEVDLDKNNLITFYNNLTVPIRIQPYGSGLTVDEGGLSWKSKVIPPNEMVAIQFNKTGYYEWNARSPPQGSENWWDFHGSGQIAAFSQHRDNSTSREKLRMAQVFVTNSDIPWSSTGLDNYGDLEIGLYESIYPMIPDAQKYYAARAMQLIPFDVPVIITSPSYIG